MLYKVCFGAELHTREYCAGAQSTAQARSGGRGFVPSVSFLKQRSSSVWSLRDRNSPDRRSGRRTGREVSGWRLRPRGCLHVLPLFTLPVRMTAGSGVETLRAALWSCPFIALVGPRARVRLAEDGGHRSGTFTLQHFTAFREKCVNKCCYLVKHIYVIWL